MPLGTILQQKRRHPQSFGQVHGVMSNLDGTHLQNLPLHWLHQLLQKLKHLEQTSKKMFGNPLQKK